jgi:hypothetical protein
MPRHILLIRCFVILAVGALWPFLSALLSMPFAHQVRRPPYFYLGVWISNPIISIPNILPWLLLAIISALRNRLGLAFWCAAVPTCGLIFWCYAYFQTMPAGDGTEIFMLQEVPIAAAMIAVVGACVGGVIQWVCLHYARRPMERRQEPF